MYRHILLTLFLVQNVKCEKILTEPRSVDIYTNYGNVRDVLKNFYEIRNERKRNRHRNAYWDRMMVVDGDEEDRFDFHYPKVEFLTQHEKVNTPNKVVVQDESKPRRNRRTRFNKFNKTEMYPIRYVQKIPKTTTSTPTTEGPGNNKYEEADLIINNTNNTSKKISGTSNSIHHLLKSFLMNLYNQKYNASTESPIKSKVQTENNFEENPKSKFFDSIATKIKNKAIDKFSLFTIVKFNNTQCNVTNSTGSYLGVCYTAAECSQIGGSASGSCANGYGVCCVAVGTCGGWASQNCSYFQSPNYPDYYPSDGGIIIPTTASPATTTNPSPTPDPRLHWYSYRNFLGRQNINDDTLSCIFSVYKTNSNVNRMRIDFLDLELAGPTNGTCVIERLVITGQDVNDRIPDICGYNTGQHIYVDVSMLSGPLQLSVLSTITYRKRFRIRICQYDDTCNEPPSNCLQYYTGVTGNITSLNYDLASTFNRSVSGYFNNLNYAICIRREAGYCSITYTNVRSGIEYPFQLVNIDSTAGNSTVPAGQAGIDILDCPDDYIVIDGVRLCGDKFNDGTVSANASLNAPVTDTNAGPIVIPVRTNSANTGVGFKLFYTQNRCAVN